MLVSTPSFILRRKIVGLVLLLPCCGISLATAKTAKASSITTPKRHQSYNVDWVSLTAHVGSAIAASAELMEDKMGCCGHGHGMLFLCGSKFSRELNTIREAIEAEVDDLEASSSHCMRNILRKPPISMLLKFFSLSTLSVGLALASLTAAVLEVVEDSSPGGHHGAVFLATYDLIDLLTESHIVVAAEEENFKHKIAENHVLKLSLAVGATIFATWEAFRSLLKLGAHHGVLILGLSKTFKCVGLWKDELKGKIE